MTTYSDAAFEHVERGPFPGKTDPWAEDGRYFQQLHSGMIGHLQVQLKRPLFKLGYIIGKEASLQIAENRQPDLAVERVHDMAEPVKPWNYSAAAAAIQAEPGVISAEAEADLQALFISELETGKLVTIVEIISPRNKTHNLDIADYRAYRSRLVRQQGVNMVEIDLTRSVKRLLENPVTAGSAYHAAVYLPHEHPRIIELPYGESLRRVALPLRGEVVPMELQEAYDRAYQDGFIAGNILKDDGYQANRLLFPSLLTMTQRQAAIEAVSNWQTQLARLQADEK